MEWLWILGFFVLPIAGTTAGAWLSARSGNLANVEIGPEWLIITMRNGAGIWAARGRLEIPLLAIRDATHAPESIGLPRGMRKVVGTGYIPGIIRAGTYTGRGKRYFYLVHNGENALVLDLDRAREPYDRVVIDIADAANVSRLINKARLAPTR